MKKFIKLFSFITLVFITASTYAAKHTVTVYNNTSNMITFKYNICNSSSGLCTMVQSHILNAAKSPNNNVNIVTPANAKLDKLEIIEAVMTSSDGKILAAIHEKCALPTDASAIVLNHYDGSKLVCQYGQIK